MYLQTLGFLMTQLSKVLQKSQKTFSVQNLSSREFSAMMEMFSICAIHDRNHWSHVVIQNLKYGYLTDEIHLKFLLHFK